MFLKKDKKKSLNKPHQNWICFDRKNDEKHSGKAFKLFRKSNNKTNTRKQEFKRN